MGAILGLLLFLTTGAQAAAPALSPAIVVGDTFVYEVRAGDTLATISSRFGVPIATLRWLNSLKPDATVRRGNRLMITNRHIVVPEPDAPLILNVAQRMVYLTSDEGTVGYPVAVGIPSWPTPRGRFTVVEKETNPTWDVPESIQEEMRREGKRVLTRVPPGPDNPLGVFFIRLSFNNVGIHGTIAPSSIFRFASHGCVRMHPDDVALLYPRVTVGMPGVSIYEPVLLAVQGTSVLIEVHPDAYGKAPDPLERLRTLAAAYGVTYSIDWTRVAEEIRLARGVAIDVSQWVGVD